MKRSKIKQWLPRKLVCKKQRKFFLYLAKNSRNKAFSGQVFFLCVFAHINFCHKNIKTGSACIYHKAEGHIVSSFLHFNQKRTTSINGAVEFWPVEFWNTTTARPLSGLNLTVSTGPPLFLGLSKNSSMASWVVSSEMLLTRMLLHTGTCWIVTRAESIPLFSPFSLILRKSNE